MGSIEIQGTGKACDLFSERGRRAVELGESCITWDIISDMWHPEKNQSGYLSAGMAENTLLHYCTACYLIISMPARNFPRNISPTPTEVWDPTRFGRPFSHFLNRHSNPFRPVEPGHALMTNGCSSAIEHLSWAFLNPGEAILLSKPYYSTFIADITLRPECVVIPVEMGGIDPLSPDAVERYERAAIEFEERTGKRVRAVMLCNPHNPLGRCYPRPTIDRLMRLCQSRRMRLISDEIYALSV